MLVLSALAATAVLTGCSKRSWGNEPTQSQLTSTVLAAQPTRSGAEVIATSQVQRTATAETKSIATATTKADREAALAECEANAKASGNVTAASNSFPEHSVTVRYPSLEIALRKSNGGKTETLLMSSACTALLEEASDEHPNLLAVKQAKDKANELLMSTVAPMITATAQANATVRSRGVTFRCERLRMAAADVAGSEHVYRHVSTVMGLAPQAEGVFFDSYDAKAALASCP